MIKHKNTYNPVQFIPKTNNGQLLNVKKNDAKLSYDEIRKIVEQESEKEIPLNRKETQIKHKFNIV